MMQNDIPEYPSSALSTGNIYLWVVSQYIFSPQLVFVFYFLRMLLSYFGVEGMEFIHCVTRE